MSIIFDGVLYSKFYGSFFVQDNSKSCGQIVMKFQDRFISD